MRPFDYEFVDDGDRETLFVKITFEDTGEEFAFDAPDDTDAAEELLDELLNPEFEDFRITTGRGNNVWSFYIIDRKSRRVKTFEFDEEDFSCVAQIVDAVNKPPVTDAE